MAITPQEQSNIIALTVGLFDAPPGAQYLAELTEVFEQNGNSYAALANFMIATPAFNAQYAQAETLDDQIEIALVNLGLEPGSAVFEEAAAYFTQRAEDGASETDILVEAVEYLLSGNVAPAYESVAAKFTNKVNVATTYSVELNRSSDDIGELKSILFNVTDDPATANATNQGLASDAGITFTLSNAVAIELSANRRLPDPYSIDADSVLNAGAVSVTDAQDTYALVLDIVANAANSDDLSADDLFTWSIEDSAAAIIDNIDDDAVLLADAVSVVGALSFEQFTALQALDNFDPDTAEVTLTLAEALEIVNSEAEFDEEDELIQDALELPALYRIELVDEPVDIGELSVAQAEQTQLQIDDIVDGAVNTDAVNDSEETLATQLSWTIEDDADAIIAAIDSEVVTDATAVVLTNTTITQVQFEALSALENFALGDTVVSAVLTLQDAIDSLLDDQPLPTNYIIDPNDVTAAVDVSVADAQSALADIDDIFAGAQNTADLSVSALFNWNIVDDVDVILTAADSQAVTGAGTVSVTNESLTQTQFNNLRDNVPNFELGNDVSVTLTLPAAFELASDEDASLPASYSINAEGAVLNAGTVSVEGAQAAYTVVADILENAANAEDLTLADLFIWQVEDNAQAIIDALESPAITEAGSVTITDEQITQGQLEQLETLGNFTLGDDVDDVEVVGVTFATQTTLATEASDGTPGEYAFTTEAIPDIGNATLLRITLGDDEVIEVGLSGATDGDAIVTALNGDTAFDDAGFEASYETTNARLVITDSQARVLTADNFELLSGGEQAAPSVFTAQLLQGTLVNTNTLNITIGGEAYILRGVEGDSGTAVAVNIQDKLRDALGDNDIIVTFANSTLTISDNQRRDISDLTVRNVPESSVSFDLTGVDLSNDEEVPATLIFTLDGETVTVDIALVDNGDTTIDVTALIDAIGMEGVTAEFDNDVLTITDALGRNVSAAELLDAGDPSEPSIYNITNITDSAVEAAEAFSLTVGDSVLERFDISDINAIGDEESGLIHLLANEFDITATYDPETNVLSLESASGAEFSGLFIGAAADEASSVTVSGLTDAYLAGLKSFSLDIGATTLEVEELDLAENDSSLLAQLEAAIEGALDGSNNAWADVSVAINEDTRTLTVTDARGRELGEPTVTAQTLPAIVANGLTDSSINFDLGFIGFDYDDQTFALDGIDVSNQGELIDLLNGNDGTDGELPPDFIASFIDNTLVIEAPQGTVLANPAFLTAEKDGFEVVSESNLQVVETLISTEVSNAVLPEAGLPGIALELEQEGVPAGLNAQEVAAPSFTNSEGTEGNIFGTEFEPGNEEGAGAEPVGEFSVLVAGSEATEAEPWMATITLESAEDALLEAYTFNLTLTEIDAEEPSIATFSVLAEAGTTLADVAELLADEVNAEDGDFAGLFTAMWDENSASFSLEAVADGVNYDLDTEATVIGVFDPGM